MFGNFTKRITKSIINDAKETVKEEVQAGVDENIPILLTLVITGIALFSFFGSRKIRVPDSTTTTIVNNYYGGYIR
jgi:hypothetical protein